MSQQVLELIFSSTEAGIEDKAGDKKIIWKDILREGEFPVAPGRKRKTPFKIVPTGKSSVTNDLITISMAEILQAHDDKAFESVTIPLRHPKPGDDQDVLNNSGYVEALRIAKKNGKHVMQAGLGFTEPDVGDKVRRGTIPNVSSGILFDFVRKSDEKKFPVALNHVCLTKQPWIDGLDQFKRVYASDEAIDDDLNIEVVDLDEAASSGDGGGGSTEPDKAEIVWNEQTSYQWVRNEVQASLEPTPPGDPSVPQMPQPMYAVEDISRDDTALVTEYFRGDRKRWVIPFELGDNKVTVAPATRWVEVREAMIAASDGPFEDKSYGKLLEKLGVELSENLGEVGKSFSIEEVSTDGRVMIKDTVSEATFLASFTELGDHVFLSGTSDWESITAPVEPKPEPTPAPSTFSMVDEGTPEGRVAAARQRRQLLLSSNHKSR